MQMNSVIGGGNGVASDQAGKRATNSAHRLAKALIVMALCVFCQSAQAVNLIANPSFEDPVRASSYTFLHTGDDIGGVWFVTQHVSDVGHVRHFPGFPEPYPDGDQIMYVGDSGDAGTLIQPISTPLTADTYHLTFHQGILNFNQVAELRIQLAPITGGSGAATTFGTPVFDQLFTLGGPGGVPGWQLQSVYINVPAGGSYGLLVIGAQDGLPTLIEDVALILPEPTTTALLGIGGVVIVPLAIRRRRGRVAAA